MCLIFTTHPETKWSDELLADFYIRNRDGIGVMWAEGGVLHYEKHLPKTVDDATAFTKKAIRNRTAVVHYRMQTHGDVDFENCHPYEVVGFDSESDMPIALMHNGVLHTDNRKDKSKSDTWHYIRDYLRPMLEHNPAFGFTPEFEALVGSHIRNNRFVLMNHLGEVQIVNEAQGVRYNGEWFSNTYAWSSEKYLPKPKYVYTPPGGYVNGAHQPWASYESGLTTPALHSPVPHKKNKKRKGQLTLLPPVAAHHPSPGVQQTKTSTGWKFERESAPSMYVGVHDDDLFDCRDELDSLLPGNRTSDRQLADLLREDATLVYEALDLIRVGLLPLEDWLNIKDSPSSFGTYMALCAAGDTGVQQ